MRRSGEPLGPLDGVPITIKDAFRMKGIRTTYGLPQYKRYVPEADAEIIGRVRHAGAIVLGRTNLPFASFDWQCKGTVFPECVNPWDTTRVAGGSSGGSSAALAAGFTPLEIGSDIAGSIRYPAHCCGVYGLRTTDGLLPNADIGPEGMQTSFRHILTNDAPESAEGLETCRDRAVKVLEEKRGYDWGDWEFVPSLNYRTLLMDDRDATGVWRLKAFEEHDDGSPIELEIPEGQTVWAVNYCPICRARFVARSTTDLPCRLYLDQIGEFLGIELGDDKAAFVAQARVDRRRPARDR